MQSCAARLNARLLKQSVNCDCCELLCKLLFIPVRVTLKLEAHVCLGICYLGRMPQSVRGRGLFKIIAHVLSWMFAIGMAGCLLVIPITAYRLFSVLFEKDRPEEINPRQ